MEMIKLKDVTSKQWDTNLMDIIVYLQKSNPLVLLEMNNLMESKYQESFINNKTSIDDNILNIDVPIRDSLLNDEEKEYLNLVVKMFDTQKDIKMYLVKEKTKKHPNMNIIHIYEGNTVVLSSFVLKDKFTGLEFDTIYDLFALI